jgi:ABC-type multidrug transport system ATPase subunit
MLRVDELVRTFRGGNSIGPVTFSVEPGERLALCGPNGSGKSTVIRCIAGTLAPTSGSVLVAGDRPTTLHVRRLVGVSLGQERSFHLRLTGHENLLFFARLRLAPAAAAHQVAAIEDELELTTIARQRVDRCSTGMVQQLAIARALVGDAPLLVLDEPTRSLDEEAYARFWHAIERRGSTALVLATHDHRDAERCDRSVDLA